MTLQRKTRMAFLTLLMLLMAVALQPSAPAQAATYFRLYSVGKGQCLAASRTTSIIQLASCTSDDTRLWYAVGHGGDYYSIVSKATKACVGSYATQEPCGTYPARAQWRIYAFTPTTFQAFSRQDLSRCIEAIGNSIYPVTCRFGANEQLFQFR